MRTAMLVLAMALLLPCAAVAQVCTDPVDGIEYPRPGPMPIPCDPDAVRPCNLDIDPDCDPTVPVTMDPVCTWINADPRFTTYLPGPEYAAAALAWQQASYGWQLCRLRVWWEWILTVIPTLAR